MHKTDFVRVIFIWSLLQCGLSSNEDDLTASISNPTIGDTGNNKGNETTPTEEKKASPITIIEARREMTGDNVKFTIKYKYDADGLTIEWIELETNFIQALNHTDKSLGDGTRETSVVVSLRRRDDITIVPYAYASASFRDSVWNYVTVGMKGYSGGGDKQTKFTSQPFFEVKPPEEFVYEDGKDFPFTITTPSEVSQFDLMVHSGRPVHFTSYLLDLETGEPGDDFGFYEKLGNNLFPEYQEWNMRLKTSIKKYSGVIEIRRLDIRTFESERDLVLSLTHSKYIKVRPSTQKGPFPSGYVDFYTSDGKKKREINCTDTPGNECQFWCLAAGDGISDVRVYRMESDGTNTSVSEIPQYKKVISFQFNDNLMQARVTIPKNKTIGILSERFLCEARNALGKTATTEIVAHYPYTAPQILRNESEIQILHKGEGSTTSVKVVCRFKAYPKPKVTFTIETLHWSTNSKSVLSGISPDEITEDGNKVTTAVKHMTYDPSEPNSSQNRFGKSTLISCVTEIGPPYDGRDSFQIPIPAELDKA